MLLAGMIWWILVGLIAGWMAAKFMKGSGYGPLLDMLIGMAGAILGGWIFNTFPLGRLLGSIVTAFVGSVILLWLVRLAKRA